MLCEANEVNITSNDKAKFQTGGEMKQGCEGLHRIVPANVKGYRWRCIVCQQLFKIAPSSIKVQQQKGEQ